MLCSMSHYIKRITFFILYCHCYTAPNMVESQVPDLCVDKLILKIGFFKGAMNWKQKTQEFLEADSRKIKSVLCPQENKNQNFKTCFEKTMISVRYNFFFTLAKNNSLLINQVRRWWSDYSLKKVTLQESHHVPESIVQAPLELWQA